MSSMNIRRGALELTNRTVKKELAKRGLRSGRIVRTIWGDVRINDDSGFCKAKKGEKL